MDIFKFGTESYVFARKTNWEKLKHWIKTLQEKKKKPWQTQNIFVH